MAKTLGCLGLLLVVVLGLGLYLAGQYNALVGEDQQVEAAWAQVENQYQRRADLVPNLVNTVRGAADFERETLQGVIDARSRVGQISAAGATEVLSDPARFAEFQAAQDGLSSALSRLLVVVERYPELRAVAGFQDLMVQLEGTENRIATERRRFNEIAAGFNTRLRRVPTAWFVRLLGWDFREKPYFSARPGSDEAPAVDFDFSNRSNDG